MADEKDDPEGGSLDERLTWNKGDLKVFDADGNEVDVSTLKEEEEASLEEFPAEPPLEDFELDGGTEVEEAGPTVHLYIGPEDVE